MKLRNLFFAAAAFAGLFSACSNDMDTAIENGGEVKAEAYASFSFSMPASAGTRAGDGAVVGSSEENQITTVNFLLFKSDGTLKQLDTRVRADFAPATGAGETVYTLSKSRNIAISEIGSYSVHVVVNPAEELTTANVSKLADYEAMVYKKAKESFGAYCADNNFMMTNSGNSVSAVITATHNINNPLSITVPVERLAAKFTFDASKKTFTVTNLGELTFDAYKVINTRNSAFDLRRVGSSESVSTIGKVETVGEYVVENWFDEKSLGWNEADNFTPNYSRRMNTYVAFRKLGTESGQPIAYALENTIKESANAKTAKGYTTGVILRAKADLGNNVLGTKPANNYTGTFYKYLDKYYYTLSDIKNLANLDLQFDAFKNDFGVTNEADYLTKISNDKVFLSKNLAIELFANGHCYYYYWIRHNDDGVLATEGIMEYTIVRNNVYQLAINSVAGLGSFESGTPGAPDANKPTVGQPDVEVDSNDQEILNPEIPGTIAPDQETEIPAIPVEPEEPVIDTNLYLNVTISVNDWTIRKNIIDL